MTAHSILLVDDEPQIRTVLRIGLSASGYHVLEAGSGSEALALAAAQTPDLLILDLGLPDMDGREVLQALRRWSAAPVLVLSVRADENEKVSCLDGGANDYMTKPFGLPELLARVRVLLRRPQADSLQQPLRHGGLQVDFACRRVSLDGREISLTPKEYAVLAMLAQQPGRVITQQQLLVSIWGPTHAEDSHYLRVVVAHLRQKLGDSPTAPRFLVTEAGVGYRLREQPSSGVQHE